MNISAERAIELAREFAEAGIRRNKQGLMLGPEPAHATLEQGGFAHDHLGMGFQYWSILFDLVNRDPNVAVMDPDHVIVLVDAESGTLAWFPVM